MCLEHTVFKRNTLEMIGISEQRLLLYLKPVQGTVVLDQKVLLLADGEVVAELAEQVGQVDSLYCYKH